MLHVSGLLRSTGEGSFLDHLNLKNKARIFLVFESCCNRNRYIRKLYFGRYESCFMTHSDKKSGIQKKLHPSHSIRYEIFPSGDILLPITRKPFFGKQMKMMISWKWLIILKNHEELYRSFTRGHSPFCIKKVSLWNELVQTKWLSRIDRSWPSCRRGHFFVSRISQLGTKGQDYSKVPSM